MEGTPGTASGSGSFLAELTHRVLRLLRERPGGQPGGTWPARPERAEGRNLEGMPTGARYNRLEANNEGYFQEYDLSSCEVVETVSRRRTVVDDRPLSGEQPVLL